MEETKPYCGVEKSPPKGYHLGSMKECKDQMARWGRYKIDSRLLDL